MAGLDGSLECLDARIELDHSTTKSLSDDKRGVEESGLQRDRRLGKTRCFMRDDMFLDVRDFPLFSRLGIVHSMHLFKTRGIHSDSKTRGMEN